MRLKVIVLATAISATSSIAFAQAPIGSSATSGNGAVINRGPVQTTGEDMDFRLNRAATPRMTTRHRHHRHYHYAR